ncbi:radical SAM/SPASM domain-containing protein [Uliginosibacterium sp. TH139]|uniref:radical SAM/SPASM domain-containing protein n=1 Tax=Uliginosibacterium sp. TH139 TaxID=2067453 RepID=UPI000C7B49BE|nr:radical SAM protein [Uliginosibacterium sp. TH139]PLK48185.1 radical SAM protein [Uliginosibacterium sp. TH139]
MSAHELDFLYDTEEKSIDAFSKSIENLIRTGDYPSKLSLPLSIQLELTDKCNLRCKHCYNRSGVGNDSNNLKPAEWVQIAKDITDHGGVFQVIISGGEPFMLKSDLFNIMDVFHKDNARFVLITNGYFIDKQKIEKLKSYNYAWMQVSIDGLNPKTHDEFRGKEGSWERAINAASMISNSGIPLKIASSLQPSEVAKIDSYIEQAYQLGASAIVIGDIMPSGRATDYPDLILTNEQRFVFLEKIKESKQRFYKKIDVQTSSFIKLQLQQASAGVVDSAIIRPNGDVRLDCVAPFVVGNVRDMKFSDVWKDIPGDIWKSKAVSGYIDSVDKYTGRSSLISNYNDKDVLLIP